VVVREITGKADIDIGRQVAVIIGMDKYREWPSLRSAVSEARSIRCVLGERYMIDEFIELYDSEFGRQLLSFLERNEEPLVDPISMYDRIRLGMTRTTPLLGTLPGNENGASFVLFLKGEPTPASEDENVASPASTASVTVLPAVEPVAGMSTQEQILALTAERQVLEKKLSSREKRQTAGWASLATGTLGSLGAGLVYFLGSQAMAEYNTATTSAAAEAAWNKVGAFGTIFPIAAAVGAAGFGLTPVFWLGKPDAQTLQESLDQADLALKALQE
jgi:hypothetical protein